MAKCVNYFINQDEFNYYIHIVSQLGFYIIWKNI